MLINEFRTRNVSPFICKGNKHHTSRNMIDILSVEYNRALAILSCLRLSMIGTPTHVGDIDAMMTGIDYNVSQRRE